MKTIVSNNVEKGRVKGKRVKITIFKETIHIN